MKAETATLIAGALGIIGTLLGVMIERLLRLTGRLRFEASDGEVSLKISDGQGSWYPVSLEKADDVAEVIGARYAVAIDLFNGREVPTGLRRVRVELVRDDGERSESRPYNTEDRPLGVDVVNIPPRQFKHLELHEDDLDKDVADVLKTGRWKRIDFVGEFPGPPIFGILGSKTYRKTITERSDWPRR